MILFRRQPLLVATLPSPHRGSRPSDQVLKIGNAAGGYQRHHTLDQPLLGQPRQDVAPADQVMYQVIAKE